MDKSAFVGILGSSNIYQGTPEDSHPPMYWITGMQTFIPAVDPTVAHEPTLVPLGYDPGAPGKNCLRQSPMDDRSPAVKFQQTTGAKHEF